MFENLAADAVFLLILIVLGSGFYLWGRRKLLGLFGLKAGQPLTVYLSRVFVISGGSVGPDSRPRSFQGPTVTAAEAQAAAALAQQFSFLVPGLDDQPGILRKLTIRDRQILILPSPPSMREVRDDEVIVSVGSPGYNAVSAWIESNLRPKVRFAESGDHFVFESGRTSAETRDGFIQILFDDRTKRRFFYVAGLAEAGTSAALLYLARDWKRIASDYANHGQFTAIVRADTHGPTLIETIA